MILDHENGYLGRGFIWTTAAVAVAAVTGPLCIEAYEFGETVLAAMEFGETVIGATNFEC